MKSPKSPTFDFKVTMYRLFDHVLTGQKDGLEIVSPKQSVGSPRRQPKDKSLNL